MLNWHETCITLIQVVFVHSSLISNITTCKLMLWIFQCIFKLVQATLCRFSEFLYKRACADKSMKHLHTHLRIFTHTTISLSVNILILYVISLPSYSLLLPPVFAFRECPRRRKVAYWVHLMYNMQICSVDESFSCAYSAASRFIVMGPATSGVSGIQGISLPKRLPFSWDLKSAPWTAGTGLQYQYS